MAMINLLGGFLGTSPSTGEQNNSGQNGKPGGSDASKRHQRITFYWVVGSTVIGILFGTIWIFLYAYQGADWTQTWSIFSVAAMLAGAFFTSGSLLGFLFGIPRKGAEGQAGQAPRTEPGKPQESVSRPAPPEVNTNLEQISDWLTKIVVGVGLTQIGSLPGWLKKYASYASTGLGKGPSFPGSDVFAIGIMIFYLVCGFLCGFLLTRLFLGGAIREADIEALYAEVESKLSDADKRKQLDDDALRIVRLQLYAGPGTALPTQDELTSKIKAASSETKGQIFYEAQNIRTVNWKDNQSRMERTIGIFRALIASDTGDNYHTNHGQLGFALRDKATPDYAEAERELTKAIEIRNKKGEKGWVNYEFVRAICRIKLLEGKPLTDEDKNKIIADLKAAAKDDDVLGRMKDVKDINDWLTANSVPWSEVQSA